MHHKYAKDGLEAISVNVDPLEEEGTKDQVLRFLQGRKATFTNVLLNEKQEVWEEKLGIVGLPAIFVFDREGRVAKQFSEEGYGAVEKFVVELLKKK